MSNSLPSVYDRLTGILFEVRLDILEALKLPHSLALALCYKYGEFDELYRLLGEPLPLDGKENQMPYENISEYRAFFQANALFSKADDLPPLSGLAEKALQDFLDCEKHNRETNTRFLCKEVSSPLIYQTSRLLSEILGEHSELDMAQNLRFGPGVSSSCRGSMATIAHKLEADITCTPRSLPIVERTFRHFFQYYYRLKPIIAKEQYNYFTTVPKTFKQERGICIGQHGNIVVQLAYGAQLRRKFKKYVDLNKAADFHQYLVEKKWREIATIDLRSASQMIARRAVQAVWPETWLSVMDDLREEYTLLPDGTKNYNQHYSAMGNGFTFEMESLLFYCLAKAAMLNAGLDWKYLSVFGDDIIVDKECAPTVVQALKDFGFVPNDEKTYLDGPFKESCGVDTLRGRNIRPIFLRNTKNGKYIEVLYKLANNISRMAANSGHGICLDASFYRAWIRVVREIPEHRRYYSDGCDVGYREGRYQRIQENVPGADTTIYVFQGRKIPDGKYGYCLTRKYSRKHRYWPGAGDIQLGLALLGGSPDGELHRNSHPYRIARSKQRYRLAPSTMVWA